MKSSTAGLDEVGHAEQTRKIGVALRDPDVAKV